METSNSGPTPQGKRLEDAKAEFLERQSGNYAKNLDRVLEKWIDWCDDRGVTTLEGVSKRTMGNYAAHLDRRVEAGQSDHVDGGIAASTAWTYYNQVSAFLSWAVKYDYLAENPAEKQVAKDDMPPRPSSNSGDQQFWSVEQRRAIVDYVDERARDAIDEKGSDAIEEVRDRALITVLAYSGVRGAEVLADSNDARRNGLRWQSVDLEAGTITVLGKNQQREETPLTSKAVAPLERLYQIVDPPADGWPVFPSRHPPSLYGAIEDADHDRPDGNPWAYVLEHGIEPPSLSTSGVRTLLKRFSEEANIPDLEDGEYLTLHGARRGVGETLFRERGAATAQRMLRHADPKTTSQMYSHIEASELGEDVSEVFNGE
ncbi:tyrosine-type recombinase/integrase [Saliphagus sp. GCM10025334]|uniref:tyrosine-type recombinase/integrase n=1 Tax=Natronosalvus caseinilyticus TaxID=2953747 RepID=UPI0028A97FD4|nr:tyrosine-type recombinase/integrase [Natronosalvus caseinilyticus]